MSWLGRSTVYPIMVWDVGRRMLPTSGPKLVPRARLCFHRAVGYRLGWTGASLGLLYSTWLLTVARSRSLLAKPYGRNELKLGTSGCVRIGVMVAGQFTNGVRVSRRPLANSCVDPMALSQPTMLRWTPFYLMRGGRFSRNTLIARSRIGISLNADLGSTFRSVPCVLDSWMAKG